MNPAERVLGFVIRDVARRHSWWLGAACGPAAQGEARVLELFPRAGLPPPTDRLRERLTGVVDFVDLLSRFQLMGVRQDSHLGLLGWLNGSYPLELLDHIPTPREMLDAQCAGRRYVTWLAAPEDQLRQIGRHHGAAAFLLHDLEHAHKFFGEATSFRGQCAFFRHLRESLDALEPWLHDPLFARDLDYLMSDMNSHPMHLLKYLKAIVLTAELRQGGVDHDRLDAFWRNLFAGWGMDEELLSRALRINRPGLEAAEDQLRLTEFFVNIAQNDERQLHGLARASRVPDLHLPGRNSRQNSEPRS